MQCVTGHKVLAQELSLTDFIGVFAPLVIGVSVGIVCLFAEILTTSVSRRQCWLRRKTDDRDIIANNVLVSQ